MAADRIGFRSTGIRINFQVLLKKAHLPCITHWGGDHFVVVYKATKDKVFISDPAYGLRVLSRQEFIRGWIGENAYEGTEEGIALILEPTPEFFKKEWEEVNRKSSIWHIVEYLLRYKRLLSQLFLGLLAGTLLQLIVPFLTQSIVDIGIQRKDIQFIYLVLFAQIMLFLGKASIEIIRTWILLHISTRVNISLVSDFFIKLMNLPIGFFDTRITGDILQRINDHKRIERLLTQTSLNTLFSFVNLLIFGGILFVYSWIIFIIFISGSVLYLLWILFFLKRRKEIDYLRFNQIAIEQSKVIELVNGMQEIKLHNAERQNRWSWEFIQARLFNIEIKSLALEQVLTIIA